jgi:hypothetical protein
MKKYWSLPLAVLGLLVACDNDNNVNILKSAAVRGKLTYTGIGTSSSQSVPKGTKVAVVKFKADDYKTVVTSADYSFVTADAGQYIFRPQLAGWYELSAILSDTTLQFDSDLVVKEDLDTLRAKEFATITYSGTGQVSVDGGDYSSKDLDINLSSQQVVLKLTVVDEKDNPLPSMRVCIYDNDDFGAANAPYCGGSRAYLETNKDGVVLFAGLPVNNYYVNVRGEVGNKHLTNATTEKHTGVVQAGLNEKTITVK